MVQSPDSHQYPMAAPVPAMLLTQQPFAGVVLHANCRRRVSPRASVDKNTSTSLLEDNVVIEERIGTRIVQRHLVNCESVSSTVAKAQEEGMLLVSSTLSKIVVDFFLPAGFPDTVSKDYLRYMLWQLPTHITGWMCSALITSSLLQAIGLSTGPGEVGATTAAIKWISKDGVGALGRLFIGGRFGSVFDEDPKQWRMVAELIGSFGGIFELATPLAPDYFLPLASLGYLTKAVAKALKDPSFRVVQNHFAIMENVGDIAAKEEVWEVIGQLIGLGLGITLLATPVITSSYNQLIYCWITIRSFHLWLRHQSLSSLELSTLNYKRVNILISEHVCNFPLSDISKCNQKEKIMVPRQLMQPKIQIGCSWFDAFNSDTTILEVKELLALFKDEDYILVVVPERSTCVLLKEQATSMAIIRSLYQAFLMSEGSLDLATSLYVMQQKFPSFISEAEEVGWKIDKIVVRVPNGAPLFKFKLPDGFTDT